MRTITVPMVPAQFFPASLAWFLDVFMARDVVSDLKAALSNLVVA